MKTIFGWAGTCLLTVWSYLLQLSRWTSRWEVVEQLHPGHICVFVMCHSSDSWLWSVLSLLITEDITCISPQQYSEALLIYWSYEILGVMGILFLLINMGVTSGWVLIICSLMGFYQLFANTDWLGWPSTWHRTHVCVWQVLISTILAAVLATLPPPTAAASSGQWHWSHDWHHTSTTPTNILLYRKYWWYLI